MTRRPCRDHGAARLGVRLAVDMAKEYPLQVRRKAAQPGRGTSVPNWTGREIRALRTARRMSVRMFASYLGVSDRMVSKWESAQTTISPRPFNQRLLDVALEHASPTERSRFVQLLAQRQSPQAFVVRPRPAPPRIQKEPIGQVVQRLLTHEDIRTAMAERDIAAMYRILQRYGVSQRQIAAATEQSQSEISEILNGRRVIGYEVLVRIAEGLGVPRAYMGLAGLCDPLQGAHSDTHESGTRRVQGFPNVATPQWTEVDAYRLQTDENPAS